MNDLVITKKRFKGLRENNEKNSRNHINIVQCMSVISYLPQST